MGIYNTDFYKTLYEDHAVSEIYEINGYLDKMMTHKLHVNRKKLGLFNTYSFELFPNYLNYTFNFKNNFIVKKIKQKLGFSINLENYTNINDYLEKECSKQHKKNIIRATARLENSFNITYKTFFGSITKIQYEFIMNSLEKMITIRFQEREGRNKTLENWGQHFEKTIRLIQEKKASLFVIYDEERPIEISINYHLDTIMYSAISSYDLDYGKFSLGNIEIFKQLEWCLSNNIHLFDMGYGDFDYKRKWSNYIYEFENHIISHKYNLIGSFYCSLAKYKFKIIDYLISKNINDKLYNIWNIFKQNKKEKCVIDYELTMLHELSQESSFNNENSLNINNEANQFLRKPIFDFLYINNEHVDNIKVYQALNDKNSFLVKGKNKSINIYFFK